MKLFPEMLDNDWELITGVDPSEVVPNLGRKFDFAVIDTHHAHPVEVLNFIGILPFLNDDAIVVLHDISMFDIRDKRIFLHGYAPRLLLASVCAEKILPNLPQCGTHVGNIAAFRIGTDTRKYIQGVFDALFVPWQIDVDECTIEALMKLVKENYSTKLQGYFLKAVQTNQSILLAKKYGVGDFVKIFNRIPSNTIFYGAGKRLETILEDVKKLEVILSLIYGIRERAL